MGIFGCDVSNHQKSFNFSGWDFAFIKSSEGNGFRDAYFAGHLANARRAGALVGAYHYQRNVSAQSQVDLIKSMVPTDVPVIIDVEDGSGPISITREIIRLLNAEGYTTPFVYIPRWFWQKPVAQGGLGSVSLAGLPPLWASWYPDYVARPREQGIAMVPQSAWNPYGGLNVAVMQFTSTPFDQNYFPGARDELAAMLNGRAPGGGGIGEDDVSFNDPVTNHNGVTYSAGQWITWTNQYVTDTLDKVKALEAKVDGIAVGEIDYDRLAAAVANMIFERLDVDIVRKGDA